MYVSLKTILYALQVATLILSVDANLIRRAKNVKPPMESDKKDPGIFPGGKNRYAKEGWYTLPPIQGAKIDNSTFTVDDKGTVITAYITDGYDAQKIRRAVIQVHGQYRDSWNQFMYADRSAQLAADNGIIRKEEALIIAPMFFSVMDKGAYPVDSDNTSNSKTVVWDASTWSDCQNAILPSYNSNGELSNPSYQSKNSKHGSSKGKSKGKSNEKRALAETTRAKAMARGPEVAAPDALDNMINFLMDSNRFPNLERVVLSGFSMGAQLVNRYIAMRPESPQDQKISFVVSSPASFMYMTKNRPTPVPKDCTGYNNYKYGLDGDLPDYYKRVSNVSSIDQMRKRYLDRQQFYFVGQKDTSDSDHSCEGHVQGSGHVNSMDNWVKKALPNLLPYSKSNEISETVGYRQVPGVAHDAHGILVTEAVQNVFFKHNTGKDLGIKSDNGALSSSSISHAFVALVVIAASLMTVWM